MKIRVRLNEINLEKEKPLLAEGIEDFFKLIRAAKAGARLKAMRGLWGGAIKVSKAAEGGGDFVSFSSRGRSFRINQALMDRAIAPDSTAFMGEKNLTLLRKALQNAEGSGAVQILDVTPPGETSKRFLAIGMSEDGPAIIGRSTGTLGEAQLTKHFEDITKANADTFLQQVSSNPANVVVDNKTAELATLGKSIDGDEYTALSKVLDDLADTEKITPEERQLYASRLDFRLAEPAATFGIRDVDAMDSAEELIDFDRRLRLRAETGFEDIDEISPMLNRIQQRLDDLGAGAADLKRVNDARGKLSDVGAGLGANLNQLETAADVDRAMETLNAVRGDIPDEEADSLQLALQARRSVIGADDVTRAADDLTDPGAPRDPGPTAPKVETIKGNIRIKVYGSREEALEAADELLINNAKLGDEATVAKELEAISGGENFYLVLDEAPAYRSQNGQIEVFGYTGDEGKLKPVGLNQTEAAEAAKAMKQTRSVLSELTSLADPIGFGSLRAWMGLINRFMGEARNFGILLRLGARSAQASKVRKGALFLADLISNTGNLTVNPAITAFMRQMGANTGTVVSVRSNIFAGYIAVALLSIFVSMASAEERAQEAAKLLEKRGKDVNWKTLLLVELWNTKGPMGNINRAALKTIFGIDDPRKYGPDASRDIAEELFKLKTKRGKVAGFLSDLKETYDTAGIYGIYYGGVGAGKGLELLYNLGKEVAGVETDYGAEEAIITIDDKIAARGEAAKKDAKIEQNVENKMDELQDEFGSTDKRTWPGASEEASPSDPKHASRKAVVNDYFTVFKDLEWPEMNDAEKVGHEKLIDMYIDWADTIGDTALLGKAGRLKKEIPVAVGQSVRPEGTKTKKESIIALPTLGKLRIRIKK